MNVMPLVRAGRVHSQPGYHNWTPVPPPQKMGDPEVFTIENTEFHKPDTEVSLECMHIWSLSSHTGGCHLLFTYEEMKAFLPLRWLFREAPV